MIKVKAENNYSKPNFRGVLDTTLTKGLAILDTKPMINASVIDVFAMDIPRPIVEYRERNKYAAAEMAFREFTGTFIACFSAGLFGQLINKAASKFVQPKVKVNNNSWASNNILDVLNNVWNTSNKTAKGYVENLLSSLSGFSKDKNINWNEINWDKIRWYDKDAWQKFKWGNKEFENIHTSLKSHQSISEGLTRLITDKTVSGNDSKNLLEIITHRIINATLSENNITVKNGGKSVTSTIHNVLRDTIDAGQNIFNSSDTETILKKLKALNSIKTFGAISLSIGLALTNQALNRYITKKRTGTAAFVGNMDYLSDLNTQNKREDKKKNLNLYKLLAGSGFILMLVKVMNINSLKDLVKRLELTGPATSGHAIKVVFGALVLGRILASKDKTELRETVFRDYMGFLNWLVLGGFVAKGVAQILDPKKENLFNISKPGKGISHWLKNISLKTHAEITAQGGKLVKENIRKLNIAHISGLAYSLLMLGIILPKLNIAMTKKNQTKTKPPQAVPLDINKYMPVYFKK
ncbi:MAG: hypothetical protein PHX18_01035 [Candidatus Gastranaerophilales bacterium]|nr:hypothetical protein [Candidatus Gastranaerophilales bacterium]